jgi:hypothetical protein
LDNSADSALPWTKSLLGKLALLGPPPAVPGVRTSWLPADWAPSIPADKSLLGRLAML